MAASTVMFIIALILFVLAAFGIGFESIDLLALGLAFVAGGLVVDRFVK